MAERPESDRPEKRPEDRSEELRRIIADEVKKLIRPKMTNLQGVQGDQDNGGIPFGPFIFGMGALGLIAYLFNAKSNGNLSYASGPDHRSSDDDCDDLGDDGEEEDDEEEVEEEELEDEEDDVVDEEEVEEDDDEEEDADEEREEDEDEKE